MKIIFPWSALLRYAAVEKAAGWYYGWKLKKPCLIIRQGQTWTVVTYNR